jgi:hypothetical protein
VEEKTEMIETPALDVASAVEETMLREEERREKKAVRKKK